jgi:hypothetical protein
MVIFLVPYQGPRVAANPFVRLNVDTVHNAQRGRAACLVTGSIDAARLVEIFSEGLPAARS